eukprot:Phypoly_transcript_03333.p1 GENE.Phypoly_transcript_03333~~Phypoly_transcript_03333.p1  ORF type:complete len:813 (+),score=166.55 Phypoly_transcript_03333:333-2441(+)
MDPKSQKFDEKAFSLTLKEDNSKKKAVHKIAKVKIDLSNFANSKGTEVITIPFVKGAPSRGPCLLATIKTKPLKYNDKPLVKVSSVGHSSSKDSRLVKTIAGEDYYLDRTASEPSPTTLDTASVASGDDDDDVFVEPDAAGLHEPDQYNVPVMGNGGGAVVEELRRRIEDLSQQVEAADSESFSRMATIRQKDKEISTLQKEVTKLHRDKDDMVEQLERLKKPAGKSDVDALRTEIVDRMAQINNLEKEVDSLKKELAMQENVRERETRNDSSSNEVAALKARCTSLQQDNERLSKLLREREREKESSAASGKGNFEDGRRERATTNVVLSRDGREDDLRRQLTTLRQELDEKVLLEKSIYCVEPQFRAGLSISATLILDVIPDAKGNKDKDKEKTLSHTLTQIVAGLETVVKRSHLDTPMLCYWLSTCISILVKLRKKQDSDFLDSYSASLAASSSSASPVTRFEYSVTALASKVYAQLVKNVVTRMEEELVGLLLHSHHMPRGTPLAGGAGLVLTIINQVHSNLLDYHVPPPVAAQLFTQIYYYINAVLFNSMLTPGPSREDLCTCNSGFRIRLQLSRLEEWIPSPAQSSLLTPGQLIQLREQLAPAVQASKLLVIDKKLLTDHEVFDQLCPVLSVAHVRRILSNYLPDALSPEPLPTTIAQTLDLLEKKERDKGGSFQSFEFDQNAVRNLSLSFLSVEK